MLMKRIAAVMTLILTTACASSPMTSNDADAAGVSAGVTANIRNAPDYIALSAPNQVRAWDFGDALGVRGFHVRGTMTTRGFAPIGNIQGNGKFCSDGQDWLSLSDLRVYSADKTPVAPYIRGCASGSGFQPASREIVTQ
jgi:hypothetical protein